jgi:hypothetical protein
MPAWTTSDYFNILPAFQQGMGLAGQRERIRAGREEERLNQERLDLTKLQADRANTLAQAREARDIEEHKWDIAGKMSQLLVDPILDPQGRMDVFKTAKAAREAVNERTLAEAYATTRVFDPTAGEMSPLEARLQNTPWYQKAFAVGMADKHKQEASVERMINRSLAIRGYTLADDGSIVPIPGGEALHPGAGKNLLLGGQGSGDETFDTFEKLIIDLNRAEALKKNVDVEELESGLPTLKRSWGWHSASPKMPGSYDANRRNAIRQYRVIDPEKAKVLAAKYGIPYGDEQKTPPGKQPQVVIDAEAARAKFPPGVRGPGTPP